MLRDKIIFSTSKDILNLIKYRSFVHLLINEAIIPYFTVFSLYQTKTILVWEYSLKIH